MDTMPEAGSCSSIASRQLQVESGFSGVTADTENNVLPVLTEQMTRAENRNTTPPLETGSRTRGSGSLPRRGGKQTGSHEERPCSVVGAGLPVAEQRLTQVATSTDLVTKVMQQNARLKTALRDVIAQRGQTVSQYLDMRERDDVITQLRAELANYARRYRALLELTTKLLERQSGNTTV